MQRLQKWIGTLGLASRREAESWILSGRLTVNGEPTKLGVKITPDVDRVALDGKPLLRMPPPRVYWMLNKPDYTLTARRSEEGKQSIFELDSLRNLPFLVSPVGRLDYRSLGLLILSNDGELVHKLCHGSTHLPRRYYVLSSKKLQTEEETTIRRGFELEDGRTAAELKLLQGVNLGKSKGAWYLITVHEGRNRLVRRIFSHFDARVLKLIRFGFGPLYLPEDLAPGECRQLTSEQIKTLKDSCL